MRISEYYELPIYSDNGNYIGEVEEVMLEPEESRVAGLVFDRSGDRDRMVPYDSVTAVGEIIIVSGGEKETATHASPEEPSEQPVEQPGEPGSEKTGREVPDAIGPLSLMRRDLSLPGDVEEIVDTVRDGDIVILDISPLMEEDSSILEDSVNRLESEIGEFGGEVGRISEFLLMIAPKPVSIDLSGEERGEEEEDSVEQPGESGGKQPESEESGSGEYEGLLEFE